MALHAIAENPIASPPSHSLSTLNRWRACSPIARTDNHLRLLSDSGRIFWIGREFARTV